MKRTFQKWLFVFVASAFIVMFALSYAVQTRQARKTSLELVRLKIADVINQLKITEHNLETITQATNSVSLLKARVFAKLIEDNPKILTDRKLLEETRLLLDADEVHVSDENGVLRASIPQDYEGFFMGSSEQSGQFMEALKNPSFELVQEPRERAKDGGFFQYAGVARKDRTGIVQVGLRPQRLKEALELADVKNIAGAFRIGEGGSIIIAKDGKILSYGIKEKIYSAQDKQTLQNLAQIRPPVFAAELDGQDYNGIAVLWRDYTILGLLPEKEMYAERSSVMHIIIFVNVILFILVFTLISFLVQKIAISGIDKINYSLAKITGGNLEEQVNVANSKEFISLSAGINSTVSALKKAIAEAAARLNRELEFAKEIQESVLPKVLPPYSGRKDFDIYASMQPAREVGGDFYDFLFVDKEHLAFLVADVSGKGIPAALFMMTTKTLLKNLMQTGMSPAEIFASANKQLAQDNEQNLFVTAFLAFLNINTGELACVNAGHNPPLIKKRGGAFEYIKTPTNIALGIMGEVSYKSCSYTLEKGDAVFLYSDGVTEAANKKEELFGEENLQKALNEKETQNADMRALLGHIKTSVDAFAQGAEQADDITMLAVQFNGAEQAQKQIIFPAKIEQLHKVLSWLEGHLDEACVAQDFKTKIFIASEEIFTNICRYAFPPQDNGEVEIKFSLPHYKNAEIKFIDNGLKYNPLEKEEPDISLPADQRPLGGLGVLMVKRIMDYAGYSYEDGKNIFTIRLNCNADAKK